MARRTPTPRLAPADPSGTDTLVLRRLRMDLEEMTERAGRVRRRFAEFETRAHGAEWTIDDLVLGLVTDVGDLAAAVQRVEGRRPDNGTDPRHALRHELSDCLWSILVIARHFDVDLAEAFPATMDDIDDWLDRQL